MLLAIDPGTNSLGWALFNSKKELVHAGSLKSPGKKDRLQRSLDIIKALKFMGFLPLEIALEDPLLRGMSNNAMQRMIGMIELTLSPVPIKYYSPMTVKAAMGSGTLDKEGMYLSLQHQFPNSAIIYSLKDDHDAIDAICIGLTHFKKQGEQQNDNDNNKLCNSSKTKKAKKKTSRKRRKSRVRGCQKRTSTHKKKRK